jgi:hypothetical protein
MDAFPYQSSVRPLTQTQAIVPKNHRFTQSHL